MKLFPFSPAILFGAAWLFSASAFGLTGLEVMQKVEKANSGIIGTASDMTMTLIDAQDNKVERKMTARTLEDPSGDKSLMEFTRPLDVKGVRLLTWAVPDGSNKQWLYLPQFKRVKKINSKNQSGSFMGSEFSYEDIAGEEIDKYTYKLLGEDAETWKVESTPKSASGYSRLISVISKKFMNPLSVEYFDRKGELLKRSELTGHKAQSVGDKAFYLADSIRMDNLQTKKSSIIEWEKRRLGIKHNRNDFKSSKLK